MIVLTLSEELRSFVMKLSMISYLLNHYWTYSAEVDHTSFRVLLLSACVQFEFCYVRTDSRVGNSNNFMTRVNLMQIRASHTHTETRTYQTNLFFEAAALPLLQKWYRAINSTTSSCAIFLVQCLWNSSTHLNLILTHSSSSENLGGNVIKLKK